MLSLYQFEISQFSEKVRLILDYKGLDYQKVEVTPGIGQLELFQKCGQRQVPVLKDGETWIADSTEIALYLDRHYPDKPIIPADPLLRGQCLLIEEWADESIGTKGRKAIAGALNQNPNFRASILPEGTPDFLKSLVKSVPSDLLSILGTGVGLSKESIRDAHRSLNQDLEALTLILENRPYLLGEEPSLADLAVASLSTILKFPAGNYLKIPEEWKGKGIPGLGDNPAYESFFAWRDRLYRDFRRPLSGNTDFNSSTPTTIDIE
jgi:glutathione S-transferase